jgi:hypothetical protein
VDRDLRSITNGAVLGATFHDARVGTAQSITGPRDILNPHALITLLAKYCALRPMPHAVGALCCDRIWI